jgi:hypothetical protein
MSRLQFRVLKMESPGGRRAESTSSIHIGRAGVGCEAAPAPTPGPASRYGWRLGWNGAGTLIKAKLARLPLRMSFPALVSITRVRRLPTTSGHALPELPNTSYGGDPG